MRGRRTCPAASPRGGRGGTPETVDTNVPLIWRTHDGGKTWTKIVTGLPSDERTGSFVNVVREDPKQKGLLFAGTETTVYVSFDDGDHWRPLRLNLPSTSIRDLVFHTDDNMNDVVIGTYGRGFWVLDDMSPLREIAAKAQEIAAAPVYFFKPGDAIRSRFNANWDQPSSVEMPHAPNPPYGAILYYHLSQPPAGEMKLQIFDAAGALVRTMSSVPPPPIEGALYPDYWLATPESRALPTAIGTNRTHWDLQYDDPPAFNHDLEDQMNMVESLTTPGPHGPQVPPGTYTLKLSVDGKVYTQTLVVHNDPRAGESTATVAALKAQNKLTLLAYQGMKDSYSGNEEVAAARAQLASLAQGQRRLMSRRRRRSSTRSWRRSAALPMDAAAAAAGGGGRGGPPAPGAMQSFIALNNGFNTMVSMMQVGLDMPPTKAQIDTWEADCKNYNTTVSAWKKMQSDDLAAFNAVLTANSQKPLTVAPTKLTTAVCAFRSLRRRPRLGGDGSERTINGSPTITAMSGRTAHSSALRPAPAVEFPDVIQELVLARQAAKDHAGADAAHPDTPPLVCSGRRDLACLRSSARHLVRRGCAGRTWRATPPTPGKRRASHPARRPRPEIVERRTSGAIRPRRSAQTHSRDAATGAVRLTPTGPTRQRSPPSGVAVAAAVGRSGPAASRDCQCAPSHSHSVRENPLNAPVSDSLPPP